MTTASPAACLRLNPRRQPATLPLSYTTSGDTTSRDVPERYGPRTTLYNRFVRWRAAGVWDRLLAAVA